MPKFDLMHFESARAALAKAYKLDEVKKIRDQAEAARAYARQARESMDMQMQIAEIKLRAERRAGEILATMEKAKGAARKGVGRRGGQETVSHRATPLDDLGITRSDSSRWQQIATIPSDRFEAHLCEQRANETPVTTASTLRVAKNGSVSQNGNAATPKRAKKQKYPLSDSVMAWIEDLVGFTAVIRTESGKRTFSELMADKEWNPGEDQFAVELLRGLSQDLKQMHKEATSYERPKKPRNRKRLARNR